ncbi:beta-galactosidase [Natronoarchaeum philippinense]|uniref:Beta-galactosidase n=1 Tax=Natronoarchaeum philippinense TaxID=558529 RepID=A0A285P6D4_NATPI|nr:glycoside hydrolase family 2 TIM barrel-domain containing protein [Natronoarchaeum philippinense]SNZ17008.1 beta-galactosidase [Natronoarchaeum philippinense]
MTDRDRDHTANETPDGGDRGLEPGRPKDCPLAPGSSSRQVKPLRTWTLVDDDATVTVPHTWNDADAVDGTTGYEKTTKRYRTTIQPPSEDDRRLFLHFEGANRTATVEIDGESVATHEGGYTAFTVDATDHVRSDEPTPVTVTVDNTDDADVPPLGGDFTFYGGLYRPVWRVETADVHIDATDHGSAGVFVDTPVVSSDRARVRVRTTVVNDRSVPVDAELSHRVLDAAGNVVTTISESHAIPAGESDVFDIGCLVDDPMLWQPDEPYCYSLDTTVAVEGDAVDRLRSTFGIREFAVEDGRITLNGEPIALRGTSRHQNMAGAGNALSNAQHAADVDRIAATGANFLRLAHYPQSHALLDAADEAGLILWEEIPVVNEVTDSTAFVENSRRMIREMVRQHYNHPSIGIWGFMNELFIHTDADDEAAVDTVREQAAGLDELLRTEDPSRPTAMACHYDEAYAEAGLTEIPDVLGWNMYVGWYYEELDAVGDVIDEWFDTGPEQAEMVSEYGAGADARLHTHEPTAWDFTEEFQSEFHRQHIAAFDDRPELAGTVQWNAFDFSAPIRDDTIPDINQKGLMTYDRQPKAPYHLYRAWLSDDPTIHIATRNWDRRAERGVAHPITVYSDLESVELTVNGRSVGKQAPGDGYTATWEISLSSGENTLVAEGHTPDGTTVTDRASVQLIPFDVAATDDIPEQGLSINVGSHRDFVTDDRLWASGGPYDDRGWGHVGGTTESSLDRINGTDAIPLYQHWVDGLDRYRLDLPEGSYRLELGFCELVHDDPGQRVFDVTVGDSVLVADFDLVDAVGPSTAVSFDTTVTVDDDPLFVDFAASAGTPLLNTLSVDSI